MMQFLFQTNSAGNIFKLALRSIALLPLQFIKSPLHTLLSIQSVEKFLIFLVGHFGLVKSKLPRPAQCKKHKGYEKNYEKRRINHDLFQGLVDRFIYLTSEPWMVVDMVVLKTPTSFERVVYVRT